LSTREKKKSKKINFKNIILHNKIIVYNIISCIMNFLPLLNVLDIISNDNNGQRLTKSGNVIQMLD